MNELLILIIVSFFTGIAVKFADYLEDSCKCKNKFTFLKISLGIFYAFLLLFVVYSYEIVAPLWLGIILGVFLAGKIDAVSHYTAITVFIIVLFLAGFPKFSFYLFLIFTILCFFEEKLNDYFDKKQIKNQVIKMIMSARPIMELATLVVSLIIGNFLMFFALLAHDAGYLIITRIFEKKN